MTESKRLKEVLDSGQFAVLAELTGGPGFNFGPIEKFLFDHQQNKKPLPEGFCFAGIALPQNPGGVANIDPADVLAAVTGKNLLGQLDCIPHVSCKDSNSDGLISTLAGYRQQGIQSILALTGDKPASAKKVFELESIGLLSLIKRLNRQAMLAAKPGQWNSVHQFYAGAAVSPYKYTEPSLMQQYYKMEKKIAAGAEFLITQVGWDWKKTLELTLYIKDNRIKIPVIGNAYWLTTLTPAPRLMHDIKLAGCFVSNALLSKIQSESIDEHIERTAQQVAMFKSLGYAGVDIGGVHNYDIFLKILTRAAEIGTDWEKFKDNLFWPAENPFYLYDEAGKPVKLSKTKKKPNERFFDFMHRAILDPQYRGFRCFKKTVKFFNADKEDTITYKLFNAVEKAFKYCVFDCQECGDCYLPENFGYCTIGGCEKGLDNAPCGDATVEGYCGNNLRRLCIGEKIYNSASAEPGGRDKLRRIINKPRIPALEHTSSLVNYLFGKDHTMKDPLIGIGESIHASIPKTGQIMKELHNLGTDAYTRPSGPLNYIRALIEDQAAEGASYIAVNLDAFGENNPQQAVSMMIEYTRLVRQWGKGVPICVDSSNDDVLTAGLKEWYNTDQPVRPPLLNSIKVYTADRMMPLKKTYDFAFIGLLVSEEKPTGPGGSHSIDELYALAHQLFDKAMQYGFKPSEIFFDSTVFPIAIDMPMEPGVPGYTYRAFETIKKIKNDPKMRGCHFSLGISNCCRDLPGRKIGICRAYVAKAMEYGLDAGIINVSHHYGQTPPDPELLKLIDAYAKLDGTIEKLNEAMTLMGQFCASCRKPV
ncbi:MAG TPA: methylenetetrahydrofolate reductase C-terminal domain-containing protein [Anaerohalosphaeraceae bacterium]|nr:methylenetetrahydrofolate reductase C-terminal domain-containing protein [Anaerohalosphaeraceae bacterium]HOL31581.1 methylenetetrahydrofolate reductase C-terminal domain-containing protein [Anaerohalosphaeraceae bacterium]HOM75592.1 methylenetetrahydrofolate reductase C-terminal domain-containing protein [Anaerohalosphaeraceae bacterium]HPC63520.1 methylenetetrahydrofolate reductase C-terminal domain-containing protein [Anaerohalosphaeraceae bacterium]HPO69543.1 methylenetetrahydrofolate re